MVSERSLTLILAVTLLLMDAVPIYTTDNALFVSLAVGRREASCCLWRPCSGPKPPRLGGPALLGGGDSIALLTPRWPSGFGGIAALEGLLSTS